MSLPVYNSKDVLIAWNGVPLNGLAPDSFITAARNSDVTDTEVGADGELAISRLPDKTGTVSLVFQQNSISNNILAGVLTHQETSRQFIVGDLTVSDPSGSVIANFTKAHIKVAPEIDIGTSATGKTRTWVFFVENMQFEKIPGANAFAATVADYIRATVEDLISRVLV